MTKKHEELFFKNDTEWRAWLEKNHSSKPSIWLIYYRKATNMPSLTWSEAVDEALCFGWIDSTKKTIDEQRYMQYFCPRKPTSTWSKVNKDKVAQLIESKAMTEAGLKCIKIAQENGTWSLLDDVDNLVVPAELRAALEQEGALDFFEAQSTTIKKQLL